MTMIVERCQFLRHNSIPDCEGIPITARLISIQQWVNQCDTDSVGKWTRLTLGALPTSSDTAAQFTAFARNDIKRLIKAMWHTRRRGYLHAYVSCTAR